MIRERKGDKRSLLLFEKKVTEEKKKKKKTLCSPFAHTLHSAFRKTSIFQTPFAVPQTGLFGPAHTSRLCLRIDAEVADPSHDAQRAKKASHSSANERLNPSPKKLFLGGSNALFFLFKTKKKKKVHASLQAHRLWRRQVRRGRGRRPGLLCHPRSSFCGSGRRIRLYGCPSGPPADAAEEQVPAPQGHRFRPRCRCRLWQRRRSSPSPLGSLRPPAPFLRVVFPGRREAQHVDRLRRRRGRARKRCGRCCCCCCCPFGC